MRLINNHDPYATAVASLSKEVFGIFRLSGISLAIFLFIGMVGCAQVNGGYSTEPTPSSAIDHATASFSENPTSELSPNHPNDQIDIDFPKPEKAPRDANLIYAHAQGGEGWFIYAIQKANQASLISYYSSDKGTTWRISELKLDPDLNQKMTKDNIFVDMTENDANQKTWVLLTSDPGAGLMTKKLYAADRRLSSFSFVSDISTIVDGYVTGIAFMNDHAGWISASYHGEEKVPLYRTTNGGRSWAVQKIELPEGFKYGNVFPPEFKYGSENGCLKIEFVNDAKTETIAYQTSDSGEHWVK